MGIAEAEIGIHGHFFVKYTCLYEMSAIWQD